MGNQTSINLNTIADILEDLRKESEESSLNEEVSEFIEDAKSLVEQAVQSNAKLESLTKVLKGDNVEGLACLMDEQYIRATVVYGHLELTALHLAAYFGSVGAIKYLSSLPSVNVNAKSRVKDTPLMLALYGAKSDTAALKVLRTLLPCQAECACSNNSKMSPLSVAIKRSFRECTKIFIGERILNEYRPQILFESIKLAIASKQWTVMDTIISRLNADNTLKLVQYVRKSSSLNEDGRIFLEDLENTLNKLDDSALEDSFDAMHLNVDCTILAKDQDGNNSIRVGDFVKTLDRHTIRENVPPSFSPQKIANLADSMATVLEVLKDGTIYVDVHGKDMTSEIKSTGVKFVAEGRRVGLPDETIVRVGSYVRSSSYGRVSPSQPPLQTGYSSGRTGKVVGVDEDLNILVQFAWGARFWYISTQLVGSSADMVEIRYPQNNGWIGEGSTVNIGSFRAAFIEYQKKQGLPFEGEYEKLPWKYAVVKRVFIRPFRPEKTVQITHNHRNYYVNTDCLRLINSVPIRSGGVAYAGEHIKVFGDLKIVKYAQRPAYGGWTEAMAPYLNQIGKIASIKPAIGNENGVMAKVEFFDDRAFYFNPRTLLSVPKGEIPKERPGPVEPAPIISQPDVPLDTMEKIKRKDLVSLFLIGEGSYGSVWKGTWMTSKEAKSVAIKKIKIAVTESTDLATIMKEAEIQYVLSQHPNIVSLFGVSIDVDVWMVLDFIDGSNLFDMLFPERGPPVKLPSQHQIQYCRDMCNAIAFIHEKGYVHVDIKSLNMMVEKRTNKLFVLDFGITRFLGNVTLMDFATQYTNSPEGTLYYIPPECLRTNPDGKYKRPKFPSDIWALGAVIFEVFTSSHIGNSSMELLQDKIMNSDYNIKKSLIKLPPFVRDIVSNALEFDQALRPSAKEMAQFFDQLHI